MYGAWILGLPAPLMPAVNKGIFFFRLNQSTCYTMHLGEKKKEFGWILDSLCPFKVALEMLRDRV